MIKLISRGIYIEFMDPNVYIHEHVTKIEFQKYSQIFIRM